MLWFADDLKFVRIFGLKEFFHNPSARDNTRAVSYVGEVGEEIVVTRWRVDLRYGLTFGKLAIYVCVYVCVLLHFHSLLLSHLLQICGKLKKRLKRDPL